MNYEYTPEEVERQKAFSDYCAASLSDPDEREPEEKRRATIRAGLAVLGKSGFPGPDAPMLQSLPFLETLAGKCPSLFVAAEASMTAGRILAAADAPAQKQRWLPGISEGSVMACVAADEAEAATADKTPGGWLVNGSWPMIANAPDADFALVLAEGGFFIVPKNAPGAAFGAPVETMGLKGTAMGDITLKGCELPPDAAVGKPGDGAALHKIALLEGCIRYAAFSIGIARTCLNKSLAHSTAKLSGGKPIFRNQEISFKLAEMYMLIDTSSLLARHAAWLHDNSDGRAEAVAMAAKLLAGESASKIAHMAVQIHGGEGYLQETGIERLCRDVRYAELARLSSEQLRMRLADGVLNGIG